MRHCREGLSVPACMGMQTLGSSLNTMHAVNTACSASDMTSLQALQRRTENAYQQQWGVRKAALQVVCCKVRVAGERCGEGGGRVQRHSPAAPGVAAMLTLLTCSLYRMKMQHMQSAPASLVSLQHACVKLYVWCLAS